MKVHKFTWGRKVDGRYGLECGDLVYGRDWKVRWRGVTCKLCLRKRPARRGKA